MTRAPTRCPVEAHLAHLQARGLAPTTMRVRQQHLQRLARHFGLTVGEELLLLSEEDLAEWQDSLQHLSASYREGNVVHIREFFRFARRRGYISHDPSSELVLPRVPVRLPHPISAIDLDTAIATAPPRVRAMLVLAAYCGLRAGEIAQLTREQVRDEGDSPMLVIIGKGNKQRAVPAPRRVLDELQRYGMPSKGPLFPWRDGRAGPVAPHTVSKLCNRHIHSLGITESVHKLRHFYGTAMYAASKDVVMVQRMLGHASVATTSGYVAYDQQSAHAAAETVSSRPDQAQPARRHLVAVRSTAPAAATQGLGGPVGLGTLTPRERDVLLLLARGLTNPQIGRDLGLSTETIRTHVAGVLRKTGASNRAGAVSVALRTGLVA